MGLFKNIKKSYERSRAESKEIGEVRRKILFEERKKEAERYARATARGETQRALQKQQKRQQQRALARSFLGTLSRKAGSAGKRVDFGAGIGRKHKIKFKKGKFKKIKAPKIKRHKKKRMKSRSNGNDFFGAGFYEGW